MTKSKQQKALNVLLKRASEEFVQTQYLVQAEFYDSWIEIGFTVEEVGSALEEAFDEVNEQLKEMAKEVNIVPGKMN